MQARLMTVTKVPPVTAEQVAVACEPHKKLQAEGKIQEPPPPAGRVRSCSGDAPVGTARAGRRQAKEEGRRRSS
jgi:hypothetical protein